jgi:CheY-like chemotaxis protein
MERLLVSERAARALAEDANRVKDEFLAVLSHELRTPLNAIVGWAQVLKMAPPTAEDLTEGIEAIERNARAQTQMIGDLLDVSRIISGKLRLDVCDVDLVGTIEAALSAIAPAADAKGIRITRMLDSSAGPVKGDVARLQQVIWNLVSNAVKFTPKGGKIEITLQRVNSHVELSVTDTGKGIAPQFLPVIFDRFRQGDASSSREHGGLGLGLSLAKQFVELHGGSIRAESGGEGLGARFVIVLPVAISPATSVAITGSGAGMSEHSTSEVRIDGVRILLVDDEFDARLFLMRLLQEAGAQVLDAEGVDAAMTMLKNAAPDVLISDIGMPQKDGFDMIREVRMAGYNYHDLPAIALTAFARPEDRRRILLSGYQMHVLKPVDFRELVAVVGMLAGRTGRPLGT